MGLWSSITSFFDDALGTGGLISDVVVPIATTAITANANSKAADKVSQGYQDQAAAIRQGNQQAQQRYEETQALTEPAVQHLTRTVAGNPTTLTPAQKASLDETRLSTSRTLNAGGLRGAGRSQLAVMRGVETGVKNQFQEQNKTDQTNAANQLSGQFFNAAGNEAALDASTGWAEGTAALGAADTEAKSYLANVSTRGQALGDVASYLNNAAKEKARESRYDDRVRVATV